MATESGSGSASAQRPEDLAEMLGELARTLSAESGLEDTLQAMTSGSVHSVPGADYAGISLVHGKQHVESVAATDELVRKADEAQGALGEGPCLDAIWEQKTVSVADMQEERRWPKFAPQALELGVRSMLSFQLYTDGRNLGALNLYSREVNAFGEESLHIGLLFATHAAVALRGVQNEKQLLRAVESRDTIGMAKGILMERHKITGDQAFDLLVRGSQTAHLKLNDVADLLVRTGEQGESAAS